MNRKVIIIGCGVLVIGTLAGGLVATIRYKFDAQRNKTNVLAASKQVFKNDEHGISFEYASELKTGMLTKQDVDDEFLARLTGISPKQQNMLMTVRFEQGLSRVASVSGKSALQVVSDNVTIAYPKRFPGFKEIRRQSLDLAGVDATEIVFTYDSPAGEKAKQHLVILAKTSDEGIYISFQALAKDFDELDKTYFKPIMDSIKFE